MNNPVSNTNSCCCQKEKTENLKKEAPITPKKRFSFKSFPSIALSILIAIFPKCPLCWAAYMSLFGFLGLSQLPYMGWLLPVLLLFLGVNLIILYKKSTKIGFLPFQLSATGSILLVIGKLFFPNQTWIVIIGLACIISGSLYLSFAPIWMAYFYRNKTTN